MSVPFIRGFPNGKTGLQEVSRSDEIEERANRFIAHGGRFLAQVMMDGDVKLLAVYPDKDGELQEIAQEISGNGFALLAAVDRLVRKCALITPAKMPPKLMIPREMA